MILAPEFPEWSAPLWEPMRYKVMHGGRASSKSWTVARALLIQGAVQGQHTLCAREVQKSIRDSVHKLLKSQIPILNIGAHWDVYDHEIRGIGQDSIFSFEGLSDQTKDSLKSYEGYHRAWVEEGQGVSAGSWEVLDPTIRAPKSEIWVTLNPDMVTDATYQRFIQHPPPNAWVRRVHWTDNPWFSDESEASRQETLRLDRINGTTRYANIWDGLALAAAAGAIYEREMQALVGRGGICRIPYDPLLPVHWVFDLGWGDFTAAGGWQRHAGEMRLIAYIEDSRRPLDWYAERIAETKMRVGRIILPHDAKHKTLASGGRSTEENAIALWGEKAVVVQPLGGLEEGIRLVRTLFPRLYVAQGVGDANATTGMDRIKECISRYKRTINRQTGQPGEPLHDEFSHGADMLRYAATGEGFMQNAMDAIETVQVIQSTGNWMAR